MIIYQVMFQTDLLSYHCVESFSTLRKAMKYMVKLAKENNFEKLEDDCWGEEDSYGFVKGFYIKKRKVW